MPGGFEVFCSSYHSSVPVTRSLFSCPVLHSPAFFSVLKDSVTRQAVGSLWEASASPAVFAVGSSDGLKSQLRGEEEQDSDTAVIPFFVAVRIASNMQEEELNVS